MSSPLFDIDTNSPILQIEKHIPEARKLPCNQYSLHLHMLDAKNTAHENHPIMGGFASAQQYVDFAFHDALIDSIVSS
jgi:hypothetical protein